jgi:hypothetical protein
VIVREKFDQLDIAEVEEDDYEQLLDEEAEVKGVGDKVEGEAELYLPIDVVNNDPFRMNPSTDIVHFLTGLPILEGGVKPRD